MITDPQQIVLSPEQKRQLAEIAERTGRPWTDVFSDALRTYRPTEGNGSTEAAGRSLYDALAEDGLIGCIQGGPADLSTDPQHMEGFGGHDDEPGSH